MNISQAFKIIIPSNAISFSLSTEAKKQRKNSGRGATMSNFDLTLHFKWAVAFRRKLGKIVNGNLENRYRGCAIFLTISYFHFRRFSGNLLTIALRTRKPLSWNNWGNKDPKHGFFFKFANKKLFVEICQI